MGIKADAPGMKKAYLIGYADEDGDIRGGQEFSTSDIAYLTASVRQMLDMYKDADAMQLGKERTDCLKVRKTLVTILVKLNQV